MTNPCKPAFIVDGSPWWNYVFEYDFEGSTYVFSVPARSEREAFERMKKIALARHLGVMDGTPVPAFLGQWYVPFLVWCRNLKLSFSQR